MPVVYQDSIENIYIYISIKKKNYRDENEDRSVRGWKF